MNYKKSLISIVAAMALSTSALADGNAIYVPMSNTVKDGQWKLIGVNGLSTGVASTFGTSTAGYTSGYESLEDTNTSDYLETLGLRDLVSVQALQSEGLTGLEIAVEGAASVTFEPKEPVRSMYVIVGSAASQPNVKINYKASLEGAGVEFYINNDMATRYYSTLSQDSTYADAVTASLYEGSSTTNSTLSAIEDVLDFNSTDNPTEAKYFDASTDLNTTGTTAIFYHFNAVTQQWEIWDKSLTGTSNDFDEFKVGDAYWGFVDRDQTQAASTPNNGGATTLILGKSGDSVPSADAYRIDDTQDYSTSNSRLSDGWNMIALDAIKPNIRHASTGLIVTTKDVNATITLTDSTGANSIAIPIKFEDTNAVDTNGSIQSTSINLAIEKAKIAGTIPPYFNIKAFGTSDPQDIILISDARFTVEDDAANDFIGGVTTLTGENPYNELGGNVVTISDLNASVAGQGSATSAYGEYALILNTLVGASSIDGNVSATGGFSKLEFGDATNGDHTAIALTEGASTLANVVTNLSDNADDVEPTFTPTVTPIDTDNDGTSDMVIVANATPFYVKDKTYTRVFAVDATTANGTTEALTISGDTEVAIIPATETNATAAAIAITAQINAQLATTEVRAADLSGNIVVASVDKNNFDLKDVESQDEGVLLNTLSTNNLAKGAIGSVHALDSLARVSLYPHTWTATGFSINSDVNDTNDTICIEIMSTIDNNGTYCTPIDPTDINGSTNSISADTGQDTNTTSRLKWFDTMVLDMNFQLSEDSLHGYAYHTYDINADNLATATVVLVSYDANLTSTTLGVGDMSAPATPFYDSSDALTLGGTGSLGGTLTSDLTTNPVHTPDFAAYGPLYTMYDAGYDVRAILKAETDLSAGTIVWDSIDLTRDEDDWFLNNEMNLFKSNDYSGYWVYLETLTAPNIVIGTPQYNAVYTYYFDKDGTATTQDSTTNIINSGSLTVSVTGIDTTTSSVFARIGAVEFEMKDNGSASDDYTADLTNYAISAFAQNSVGPTAVTIRVTNGKGEYKKDSSFEFDFQPPTINTPDTTSSLTSVEFDSDDNSTTFHIFKDYIPELASTRAGASTTLISTGTTTTGKLSLNICKELTFGEVNEIVAVTADGTGVIGTSNLSDAEVFDYAVMLKGAHVLSHTFGSADLKATHGVIYDDNCAVEDDNTTIADNSGVSVKSLIAGTAYLSYSEIDGVGTDLSGAYNQEWSDGTNTVIQTQNLDEYAGKVFFVEYGGTMYTGVFPSDDLQGVGTLTAITPSNNTLQ